MDDPRTDEALMLAYRDGDAAAFEALYGRWRGRLYRYLAHQAADRADELFQDVWLRVVGARAGYEVTARFSTWLFRIAHNRLMDHYRARGRAIVDLYDDPEDDPAERMPAPEADSPRPCWSGGRPPGAYSTPWPSCRRPSGKPSCWRRRRT
jgi:RNA polymerase sigma factor (sigma-70 family)